MSEDKSPSDATDKTLLTLMETLQAAAKTQLQSAQETAGPQLEALAELFQTQVQDLTDKPERAAAGVRGFAEQMQAFVEGAVSRDAEQRARKDKIQQELVARMKTHGIDLEGKLSGITSTLESLTDPSSPIAPQRLAESLRKMADALDGDEDPDMAPDTFEKMRDALEDIGRGLTGTSREEEAQAEADRIAEEARSSVSAALADFKFE